MTNEELRPRNDFRVDLIDSMGGDESVVRAARVSTASDDRQEGGRRLIRYLLKHGHWSPFEHVYFTFRSEIPIFLARQVMRHQHNFNEMSMRYSEALPHFYLPDHLYYQHEKMMQGRTDSIHEKSDKLLVRRAVLYGRAYGVYQNELEEGVAREQAREVLPTATYTVLYTTMNLRSLLHFTDHRGTSEAQSEARTYSNQIKELAANTSPVTLEEWGRLNE